MAHFATIVLVNKQRGSDRDDKYIVQKVKEILAPYDEELEVESYEVVCDYCHDGKMKKNLDCVVCQGSGMKIVDWNPQGEWDYWIFGGRYDGLLVGNPGCSKDEEDWQQWFMNNCISTEQLIEQTNPFIPYVIVSQKGWYERGKIREEDWREKSLEILKQHLGHWGVLCDLHC